jgi:anti-anti-sigma regulatory factor
MLTVPASTAGDRSTCEEILTRNPISKMKKPPSRSRGGDQLPTEEGRQRLLAEANPRLRDFLVAVNDTGARPGEVAKVTAADFNPEIGAWVLSDHKSEQVGAGGLVAATARRVYDVRMTPPCQNYHSFIRALPDGFAVHPVGHLWPEGEWLRDERLVALAAEVGPRCLYLDCSRVEFGSAVWLSHLLRLYRAVWVQGGKILVCGVPGPLGDVLAATRLDEVTGVRKQEVPGGRLRLPEPSWLAWNGGTVPRLVRAIGSEGAFDRMPVLADALEEAGCTDADILGHCRSGGPHLPDCWVLGLLAAEG